ncbi:MAG: CAP domain-containing protein, partial [Bdellovibrionota bacterium]
MKRFGFSAVLISVVLTGCEVQSTVEQPSPVGTFQPISGGGAPPPSPAPAGSVLDAEESAFVGLINDYRAQNGAPALQVSAGLTASSHWLSTDMAAKNYFSHTDSLGRDPFTRMDDFNYPSTGYRGENIAAGNATAQATFDQWKSS